MQQSQERAHPSSVYDFTPVLQVDPSCGLAEDFWTQVQHTCWGRLSHRHVLDMDSGTLAIGHGSSFHHCVLDLHGKGLVVGGLQGWAL